MKKQQGRSKVFNKLFWLLTWGGVIFCMLFGMIGCRSEKRLETTPEQKVQSYLENKYGRPFEIMEFSRKNSAGPFLDSVYTGRAFAAESPALLFDIWGSKDLKSFEDSFFITGIMPEIDAWLSSKASEIWEDFKVRDQVRLLEYRGEPAYEPKDIDSFYENEFVRNRIYLYLPDHTDKELASEVWDYMQKIHEAKSGILYIYLLDDNIYESLDPYDPSLTDNLKCTFSVSLGVDRTAVENALW